MGMAENKALVQRFWEIFSSGDFERALGLLSEDATWWVAGSTALSGTYSKSEFAKLLEQVGPMAPDGLQVTPKRLVAEGDLVCVEAESHAELTNGKTYQNAYHFLIEVRDGKLVEVREYLDTEHVTAVFGS